jgi:transaldolase
MEIWLDSININLAKKGKNLGILHGITTNPAILSESNNIENTINRLLDIQEGPITYQVTAATAVDMIKQGLAYKKISKRILVKVPVTQEGLKAMHNLSQRGVSVMATIIFDYRQYLLATKAGAHYAALYYSAIINAGGDANHEIARMCKLKERHGLQTKILAASIKNLQQAETCLDLGVDAITLKDFEFQQFMQDHPATLHRQEKFLRAGVVLTN